MTRGEMPLYHSISRAHAVSIGYCPYVHLNTLSGLSTVHILLVPLEELNLKFAFGEGSVIYFKLSLFLKKKKS
jgi:hypothetical protein